MPLILHVAPPVTENAAAEAVTFALEAARETARNKVTHYQAMCLSFEIQTGVPSADFRRQFEAGDWPDTESGFTWYTAWRGAELWAQRLAALEAITVQ